MKKFFSILLISLSVGSAFLPGTLTYADTGIPSAIINSFGLERKDGQVRGTAHIQLDATGMALWEKSFFSSTLIRFEWEKVTSSNSANTLHFAPSQGDDYKSCTHDKGPDDKTDNNFTCVTEPLNDYGTYAMRIFEMVTIPSPDGNVKGSVMFPPLTETKWFDAIAPKVLYKGGSNIDNLKYPVSGDTVKISGTFNAAALDYLKTRRSNTHITLDYGEVVDHEATGGVSTPFTEIKQKNGSGQEINVASGQTAFTGSISGLEKDKNYVFNVEVTSDGNSILGTFTGWVPFITGKSSPNPYKLVDPVSTGGTGVDTSGDGLWASPEITIDQPDAGTYRVIIGVARPTSAGDVHYTCYLSDTEKDMLGPTVSVPAGLPSAKITNKNKFTKLQAGSYCAGLQSVSTISDFSGGEKDLATNIKVNPPDGEYFVVTSAGKPGIFSVGGVVPPPGATLDPTANGNGCSTDGESNTTYCLLAPLPGFGDGSGKLDVSKGIGDYVNLIIKLIMGLIGVLSVLMIVVGGVEYMSTVNIGEKEGAKERITSALFGLLLALASYLILNTINPKLVNLSVVVKQSTVSVDLSAYKDSQFSTAPTTVTSADVQSAGVYCPGTGGSAEIPKILNSYIGKVTYRFGGGHGSNKPSWSEIPGKYMCPVGSTQWCGTFCPPGQLCLDCSAFSDAVQRCAGFSPPGRAVGTGTLFSASGAETIPSGGIVVNSDGTVVVNGKVVKNGDLFGWVAGENDDDTGHVLVYSNGQLYSSHGGNGGREPGKAVIMQSFSSLKSALHHIYRSS